VQLLPEDSQSILLRKKRDELIKLIDRTVKLLEETRATIIERTDLKTLISNEIKLRELADLAGHCKIAFKSSMNVVT